MTFIPLRAFLAIAAGAALALAAGGCSSTLGKEPPCMPPEYTVIPESAVPGETVAVAAADALCNPRYGEDALIQITIIDQAGQKVVDTVADMNDGGGFSYSFEVPAYVAPGQAQVSAWPYGIDWCDDTGINNRAAGEPISPERASCATPVKPLAMESGSR